MNAPLKLSRDALNDHVQDHLHVAQTHALQVAMWLQKTIETASYGKRNLGQTIAYARDQLRESLRELDAFEAAVYPADPEAIRDSTDGEAQGHGTEEAMTQVRA